MINNNGNLEQEQSQKKVKNAIASTSSIVRPRLNCEVKVNQNSIVLYQSDRTLFETPRRRQAQGNARIDSSFNGVKPHTLGNSSMRETLKTALPRNGLSRSFVYQASSQLSKSLPRLFFLMDGTKTVKELQQIFAINNPQVIVKIISDLEKQNFINDATPLEVNSGSDVLKELECQTQDLLISSYKNNLWQQSITSTEFQPAVNVLYGFALEQYQICSRKSAFYSPALSYCRTERTRTLIDKAYCQEMAQSELLLEALNTVGVSNRELADTIPLSETVAMCQGLAYWANSEPLFFFYAIATIKQQASKNWQAYLEVCEQSAVETRFISLIRKVAHLNRDDRHQRLIRCLFQEVPHLEEKTKQRFEGQTYLLVEMYSQFQSAIWNHYSSTDSLWRSVSLV